jgi:hypothetical protein
MKDKEIKNIWREYFNKLFNDGLNRHFVCRNHESKVKDALRRIK